MMATFSIWCRNFIWNYKAIPKLYTKLFANFISLDCSLGILLSMHVLQFQKKILIRSVEHQKESNLSKKFQKLSAKGHSWKNYRTFPYSFFTENDLLLISKRRMEFKLWKTWPNLLKKQFNLLMLCSGAPLTFPLRAKSVKDLRATAVLKSSQWTLLQNEPDTNTQATQLNESYFTFLILFLPRKIWYSLYQVIYHF